jgi:predicted nucleic acid-binding protein
VQPALLDTSTYISALRRGHEATLALRCFASGAPIWLSAIVLEELYAGTNDRDRQVMERIERHFDGANRVLVPNLNDWTQAGKMFAQLASKYDYEIIGRSRLVNDALIAMSAGRMGIRVVTAKARDFARLAEFRAFEWEVATI